MQRSSFAVAINVRAIGSTPEAPLTHTRFFLIGLQTVGVHTVVVVVVVMVLVLVEVDDVVLVLVLVVVDVDVDVDVEVDVDVVVVVVIHSAAS